jgi:hypothetical protein
MAQTEPRPLIEDVMLLDKVKRDLAEGKRSSLTLEQKRRMFVVYHCLTTVYFIAATDAGMIKIGKTVDLPKRFATLSTMSPVKLEIVCSVAYDDMLEGRIHKHLKKYRSHGEWFYADKPVLDFVRNVRDKGVEWVVSEVGEAPSHWMNRKTNITCDMKYSAVSAAYLDIYPELLTRGA